LLFIDQSGNYKVMKKLQNYWIAECFFNEVSY